MTEAIENIPARKLDLPYLEPLMAQLDVLPHSGAMNIEALDGFFAGLICAQTLVMPSVYLPSILGGSSEDIHFENADAFQDFFALLTEHWNHMAQSLKAGELFLPLLLEDEQGNTAGNDWAGGFARAIQIGSQDWSLLLDDEEHGGALVPILALAHEHDPDPEMRPYGDKPVSDEQRENLLVGIAAGVTTSYAYFEQRRGDPSAVRRATVEPYQRASPKIGRNEPCPCGSGRKYKQCHGKHIQPMLNQTLH